MEAVIIKESDNSNLQLGKTAQKILIECDKADAKKISWQSRKTDVQASD